jgi:predicted ATPase/class 3 adenylate cyclase
MALQPMGTVTLLFTDVEGSTRLLERLGRERYAEALDLHRRLLRGAFECHDGYEVDYEGDAFFVAFARAGDAVAAAAEAQQALAVAEWPEGEEFRVRMGIHSGEPLAVPPKYVGIDVHRAARIMAAGHGGQVLLSEATRHLLDEEFVVRDLGDHRLKDLSLAQRLYELHVAGVQSEFPPLKTLENRLTNLPVQPNPLIGRAPEVAEVVALLRDGDARLVTLTGTGGTGKTRFALQVGAELVDDFADGVFFVPLAPIRDRDLVLSTVAHTLVVPEVPGEDVFDALARHLAERQMLVVLDNFEQVVAAATGVGALLQRCAQLKLLVTSRERLRLAREQVYPLPPLPLPEPGESLAVLAQNDAVALFAARAQAATGAFILTGENVATVAAICRAVDGLPLAIELAAARVTVLSPEALLLRLDQRLKVLAGGGRDLEERQRTLRNTIAWSYDLLDDESQTLFDRLAVFVGGRSLDAIEAICNPEGTLDVLSGVASLVDQSLLRRDEAEAETRFVMLETLHEYARERLEGRSEAEELRIRHMRFYREFAEAAEPHLHGSEQEVWLGRLTREQDNLRTALTTALDGGDGESALMLAGALAPYWEAHGHFLEAQRWFEDVLKCDNAAKRARRALVLFWAGRLALFQGKWVPARELLAEGARLAEHQGDTATQALILGKAGWVAVELGAGEEAGVRLLDEAVTLARARADEWVLAEVLNDRACALMHFDLARAEEAVKESLQLRRRLDDAINVADSLNNLGYMLLLSERPAEAEPFLEESLALAQRYKDTRHIALALGNLGFAHLLMGRLIAAGEQFAECIRVSQGLGDTRDICEALLGLAALATISGANDRAAKLSGAVTNAHLLVGSVPSPGEVLLDNYFLAPARAQLHDDSWRELTQAGEEMTLEAAVTFAFGAD